MFNLVCAHVSIDLNCHLHLLPHGIVLDDRKVFADICTTLARKISGLFVCFITNYNAKSGTINSSTIEVFIFQSTHSRIMPHTLCSTVVCVMIIKRSACVRACVLARRITQNATPHDRML